MDSSPVRLQRVFSQTRDGTRVARRYSSRARDATRRTRVQQIPNESGRRDSNSRPLVPQTNALTRLRHAPRRVKRSSCGRLTGLDGAAPNDWEEQDDALVRVFEFESFSRAIDFVVRLADAAESANHHPDIDIRYRRVTVRWTTHSAGGITDRDREMAARTASLGQP